MQQRTSHITLLPWGAQKKNSLIIIIPDTQEGDTVCLPRPPPLLDFDKVEWKLAKLSGFITLGDILVIRYNEQDQLLMTE